jgi:hypothetical protein
MLILHVGIRLNEYTVEIPPQTRKDLTARGIVLPVYKTMSVDFDVKNSFEAEHGADSLWINAAEVLTGLSLHEIDELGGFKVINPLTRKTIYDSTKKHVEAR